MKKVIEYKDLQHALDILLQDKESNEVEYKSAAGGFPKSFWETYSSFANTNGGAIVFGVKEIDGFFFLDGLTKEKVQKYERDFFNNMHNKQNVNIPLLKEKDIITVPFKGSYFMIFYVPRVEISLRPVYCGLDPYTGTYRRDVDGDYHCSREEVTSMFSDANLTNTVDGRILKNYSIYDLDPDSIKQYRRKFEQWNPDHVWNLLSDDDFLKKINVFRKDRTTGEYGLTFAGLLMFGTYSAIMDENPNFFPDYQEIQDPKDRWINRIYPDGNWESNLFQFYNRVLPILQNYLPKPFQIEGNQRKVETPAHVAIREALANTLVHADYTENASLNIFKYPNKIVFSNPGTMLISLKQYYQGGESVCRNKYLQTMFTFLGSAEKAGSGVDKIIHGWEDLKWKRPYIMERSRPNKVVLTMSMESLLDDTTLQALEKRFGEKIKALTQNQLIIMALAYTEEIITNERLQYALTIHRTDISKLLSKLCSMDLLKSSGYGRGTRYHINDTKIELNDSNTGLNDSNTGLNDSNTGLNDSNTGLNDSNTGLNDSNTGLNDSNTGLSKKRYSFAEIRELIIEYCTVWRTADEIAIELGKSPAHIRDSILPRLTDVIEKMYDIPHHPKQKYRTIQTKTI